MRTAPFTDPNHLDAQCLLCWHHPDAQCLLCRHHPDAQCLLCRHHPDAQCLPVQTPSWHSEFACADTILTLSVCLWRHLPDVQCLPVQTPSWHSVCLCRHHPDTQCLPMQTPPWRSVFAYADTTLTLSVCLCRHHPDAQFYCADTILTLSVCLCSQHPDVQCLPVQTPPWRSVFACADSPSQRPLPSSSCLVSLLHASSYLENRDDGILPARFSASINFILLSGTSGSCNHKIPAQWNSWWKLNPPSFKICFFLNISVTFHVNEPLTTKNTLIFCWIFLVVVV